MPLLCRAERDGHLMQPLSGASDDADLAKEEEEKEAPHILPLDFRLASIYHHLSTHLLPIPIFHHLSANSCLQRRDFGRASLATQLIRYTHCLG